MSTWQLEHVGTTDKRPLDQWGIERAELTFRNFDTDQLVLTVRGATAATDAPAWSYLDKFILWRDDTRVFHGWLVQPANLGQVEEAQEYRIAGPWWWLAHTPFQTPYTSRKDFRQTEGVLTGVTWVLPDESEVEWESPDGWKEQHEDYINGQLNRALYAAIQYGVAPIELGTIDLPGRAPAPRGDETCASVIQRASRYSPLCFGYWDYSGETPTFNAQARGDASALSLAIGTDDIETFDLSPLNELQMHVVRIRYEVPNAGGTGTHFTVDEAGDTDWPDGPGALVVTVPAASASEAFAAVAEGIAQQLYDALSGLAWSGSIVLHETDLALPLIRPGRALNVTGGLAAWSTMAALVQQVTYVIAAAVQDQATITLGAPDHLGVQDLLELNRLGGSAPPGQVPTNPPAPGGYIDLLPFEPVAPSGALEFSSIEGTCELIGFSEYTSPSSPPKKYLTRTLSGSVTQVSRNWCFEAVDICTDGDEECTIVLTASGSCSYNPTTGTLTEAGNVESADEFCDKDDNATCTLPSLPATGSDDLTQTTRTRTWDEPCELYENIGGCRYLVRNGSLVETLSNEDTDENASARMEAAGEWSAWSNTGVSAAYEQRTSGFEFFRRRVKIRGAWTGGLPLWWYKLQVVLEERAYGSSDPFVESDTLEFTLQPNFDGEFELDETEIECAAGKEVRVKEFVLTADG